MPKGFRLFGAVFRAGRSVVLGLFILWQLLFLLGYNLLDLARETRTKLPERLEEAVEAAAPGWTRKEGPAHETVEKVMTILKHYEQATGQPQRWSLFAPDVAEDVTFPAVEMRWEEPGAKEALAPEPEVLRSANEPEDLHRYMRLGNFRLRRYETNVGVVLTPHADETEEEMKARWRAGIQNYLRKDWDTVRAYLRWRWQAYVREYPDRPEPRMVILLVRRYHIPAARRRAEADWEGPYVEPVARWRPFAQPSRGRQSVEMYNPVAGDFEEIP
jgi:hypothetical protein